MSRIYQQANSNNNKPSPPPPPQTALSSSTTTANSLQSSASSSANVSPSLSATNLNNNLNRNLNYNSNNNQTTPKLNEEKMSQDLVKLISRLETVTSRLETYASSSFNPNSRGASSNGPSSNGSSSSSTESFDHLPSILAFDDLYNNTFSSFKDLTAKLGPDVKAIVDLVEKLFKVERSFLIESSRSMQPAQDILMKFYQQFGKHIEEIQQFREKNRSSQLFNHLSAISESIGAFGWISVSPAPSPYVKEMSDAAQFYTNRVLKDYKEKDLNHVNWVKLWLQFLSELQAYVKQHHTTGVAWNSSKKGDKFDLSRVSAPATNGVKAVVASAGGPPPPPPPPMPNFTELLSDDNSKNGSAGRAATGPSPDALFAEINKGSDITKGLKHVSDAEKTHKNNTLRSGSTVPGGSLPTSSRSYNANVVQKPPVLELVDKKWNVEYQSNKNDLLIDQTDLKHTIYIYQCKECTITVKGKVNSIVIDSCNRVALLFDDVLSTVEFINSRSVQMQVLGRVPTVIIEKTDGCQVYLSKKSLDTEVVSSKSSAMNVLTPSENGDDFTEHPIPEQFKTIVNPKTKKLITTQTELV